MPTTATNLTGLFPWTPIDLTDAIDQYDTVWGRVGELGVFGEGQGLTTAFVEIEHRNGVIHLLDMAERGEPPKSVGGRTEEGSVILKIPHIPHMDKLTPADLQRFAFNTGRRQKATREQLLSELLLAIRRKHQLTLEWLRMSALKGVLVDARTATVYNFFDVFGITKKSVNFALSTAGTDVRAKCMEVVRHMEDNLRGEVMTTVRAVVASDFFDALVSHPNVEKYYLQMQDAALLRGADIRKGFTFGGITFEEYRAVSSDADGTTRRFISDGYGHAYPEGTMETFRLHFGPPHHWEYAAEPGMEIFVSPKILDHGEGIEMKSQSNPLPVVRRPALLVELIKQ